MKTRQRMSQTNDFENVKFTPSQIKKMSLLKLIECIVEQADHSGLSDEFFDSVDPLAKALGKRLDITPRQAVLYSVFVDNYHEHNISINDVCRQTNVRPARLAQYQDDLDALEMKRYIRRCQSSFNQSSSYCVPSQTIRALNADHPYAPVVQSNLTFVEMVNRLDSIFEERYDLGTPYDLVGEDLLAVVKSNQHLKCAQILDQYYNQLNHDEWVVMTLLLCTHKKHGSSFEIAKIKRILDDVSFDIFYEEFDNGETNLQQQNVVEYAMANGMVDKERIRLSQEMYKQLFGEQAKNIEYSTSSLLPYEGIKERKLFYNDTEKAQIADLLSLLTQKNFSQITSRMKAKGLKRGFICLFYGAAGTGKTETVLQLAKATKRNILQVDFSSIKDKFVGESEKNVKAIFQEYRMALRNEKRSPILLFNEADALICKRNENATHSVDNMYNTMQNILLQEMENFEGILIATTNLEGNMDSAFERRFLYKVRFENPEAPVRQQIWQSMVPELSEKEAYSLAHSHSFSGGQIANISRKLMVDNILYGDAPDLGAKAEEYCKHELLQKSQGGQRIGFAR